MGVEPVPPEATVVGIPARIVKTDHEPSQDPYRVPLDHHLIPDPVGRTLARLADRIAFLETRLSERDQVLATRALCCGDRASTHPTPTEMTHATRL